MRILLNRLIQMSAMIQKPVLGFLIMFVCLNLKAQDPIYSQYFSAPLQVNPAFAGNSEYALINMNYRYQWPSIPNAYRSYSVSYDQYFANLNSGFGVRVLSDDAGNGILKTVNASVIYSYKVRLYGETQMKFGMEVGGRQYKLNWDKLVFGDQLDVRMLTQGGSLIPSLENQPDNLGNFEFDLGAGVMLFNEKYYGGVSMKHINSPRDRLADGADNRYSGLPVRWTIHAGAQISFDNYNNKEGGAFLSPNIMVVRQADLLQINAGTLLGYRRYFTGFWVRQTPSNLDALIGAFGVRTGVVRISYTYDFTLSSINVGNTGGTHELGLVINMGANKKKKSSISNCFEIFL